MHQPIDEYIAKCMYPSTALPNFPSGRKDDTALKAASGHELGRLRDRAPTPYVGAINTKLRKIDTQLLPQQMFALSESETEITTPTSISSDSSSSDGHETIATRHKNTYCKLSTVKSYQSTIIQKNPYDRPISKKPVVVAPEASDLACKALLNGIYATTPNSQMSYKSPLPQNVSLLSLWPDRADDHFP